MMRCACVVQEGISKMDGFQGLGSMLGYLEVFGVMFFSWVERWTLNNHEQKIKTLSYAQLTLCLLGTSYLR